MIVYNCLFIWQKQWPHTMEINQVLYLSQFWNLKYKLKIIVYTSTLKYC